MAKTERSRSDWDKYNWGLWVCEREIKLDCPWGRGNICKAVLARCLRLSSCWLAGRRCWRVGLGKMAPWGKAPSRSLLAEAVMVELSCFVWWRRVERSRGAQGELWFCRALLGGMGTTAGTVWDRLFEEFECQAPSCHGKSVGFRCLEFLTALPPSSEPCAYHHPDHFPCVTSASCTPCVYMG